MSVALREREFFVNGLHLAAKEWGEAGGLPVIALHGWLDNSASFDHVAPLLKGLHIIALDMAGHGRSDHRLGAGAYSFWDDILDIFCVADELGWQQFSLLGHSRGAIISAFSASCFPERIQHLALIEGISSEPLPFDQAPEQMAQSLKSVMSLSTKSRTVYPDLALACKARMKGVFPLSEYAAMPLTLRGVKPVEGGYSWSSDLRLMIPSPMKLSREQIDAFLKKITCPTQLVLGDKGLPLLYPHLTKLLDSHKNIPFKVIEGGHHLHLEQQCAIVADVLNDFFCRN